MEFDISIIMIDFDLLSLGLNLRKKSKRHISGCIWIEKDYLLLDLEVLAAEELINKRTIFIVQKLCFLII